MGQGAELDDGSGIGEQEEGRKLAPALDRELEGVIEVYTAF